MAAGKAEESRSAEEAPPLRLHSAPPPHAALLCGFLPELLQELLLAVDCSGATPRVTLWEAIVADHVLPTELPSRAPNAAEGVGIERARATTRGAPLHVDGVVATLARLFDRALLHCEPRPAAHAVLLCGTEHLLRCFKETALRMSDAGNETEFEMWMTPAVWEAYLESRHASLEMPSNALLRSFDALAMALTRASVAIAHFAEGNASIALACTFTVPSGRSACYRWPRGEPPAIEASDPKAAASRACSSAPEAALSPAIRFPYFAPLLAVIERQMVRGLPAEWWLQVGQPHEASSPASLGVSALDMAALAEAEVLLRQRLQAQLLRVCKAKLASWQVFLCLVEDWCLCVEFQQSHERHVDALLRGAHARGAQRPPFELELVAPEAHWHEEVGPFLKLGSTCHADADRSWQVSLRVSAREDGHCLECR